MQSSETEDGAKARLETLNETGGAIPSPETTAIPGLSTLVAALVVALASGVVAWNLGETIRVAEVVDLDEFYGGAELSVARTTRNGVVSYAILGAILSLGLGMSAGSLKGPRSFARLFLAGFAGAVLGSVRRRGELISAVSGLFPPHGNRRSHAFDPHPPGNLDGDWRSIRSCFRDRLGETRHVRQVFDRRHHGRGLGSHTVRYVWCFLSAGAYGEAAGRTGRHSTDCKLNPELVRSPRDRIRRLPEGREWR